MQTNEFSTEAATAMFRLQFKQFILRRSLAVQRLMLMEMQFESSK